MRSGIGSLGVSGDAITNQTSRLSTSPWRLLTTVTHVYFRCGINDIAGGASGATVVTRIQAAITAARVYFPTATFILGQLLPCKTYLLNQLGASYYTAWSAVNASIAAHAITGVDAVHLCGDVGAPLNDGADNIPAALVEADLLHPNNAGRLADATSMRPHFGLP